jgi:hypothetical protein
VTVGHALSVGVSELHPEAVGDRVAEEHTVGVTDTLADPVDDRQREAVGLPLGLIDCESETVAQEEKDRDSVLHPEAEVERVEEGQTEAVTERLPEPVEDRQREAEALTEGLAE